MYTIYYVSFNFNLPWLRVYKVDKREADWVRKNQKEVMSINGDDEFTYTAKTCLVSYALDQYD